MSDEPMWWLPQPQAETPVDPMAAAEQRRKAALAQRRHDDRVARIEAAPEETWQRAIDLVAASMPESIAANVRRLGRRSSLVRSKMWELVRD